MANVAKQVKWIRGAAWSVASCPYCRFLVRVPRGRQGVGRGNGFATSSTARATIVTHIKAEHKDKLGGDQQTVQPEKLP